MTNSEKSKQEQTFETQFAFHGWYLLALIGVLIIVQLVVPHRAWMMLLVVMGGLWAASAIWSRALVGALTLTRQMRFGWARVGDQLLESFQLTNDSRLPALWVDVVDHSTMPGYGDQRVTAIYGYNSTRWYKKAICTHRGLYTFGPTTLRTGDPFGLYTTEIHDPASASFLVLPPIVELEGIEELPAGRSDEGRPRPNALNRSINAMSVREYAPGDSLRWIHWPTTARQNELFVRQFEGSPSGDWRIVLDMDWRVQAGSGREATDEYGVILAASLADRGLRLGRSVGLMAQGKEPVWLSPRSGEGHRWELMRALALISEGDTRLSTLLAQGTRRLQRAASVYIITPSLNREWIEQLVPLVARGMRAAVLLVDPTTFGAGGRLAPTVESLTDLGIPHHIVSQGSLDLPDEKSRADTNEHLGWRTLRGETQPAETDTRARKGVMSLR